MCIRDRIVRGVQPICFDNAVWAYTLGTAIAVKRGLTDAAECAAAIGEGLEAFTIPGSVAEPVSYTHLQELVEYNRKFAGYYDAEKAPYDALLNEYERGVDTQQLDVFFRCV